MRRITTYFCSAVFIAISATQIRAQEFKDHTIQDLYYSVDQLEGAEDQELVLKEIIRKHQTNEALYRKSVIELVDHYEKNDQHEKAMVLLGSILTDHFESKENSSINVFETMLGQLSHEHPDLMKQVGEKINGGGDRLGPIPANPEENIVEMVLQREDEVQRERGLEKIAEMLAENQSDDTKKRGLSTLLKCISAKFYRPSFQQLVLPLIESEDAIIRALSLRLLPALETPRSELIRLAELVDDEDPQVRKQLGGSMIGIDDGETPEIVIPVLMRLCQDENLDVRMGTIRSMWGRYSTEEFDKFLIELSYDRSVYERVVYNALSTKRTKSLEVCKRLVEVLEDPDWNNSGRAAWGLTYGVETEAYPFVENAVLKALPHETNSYTRKNLFRALATVGTEKSKPYLNEIIQSDLEAEEDKEKARAILEQFSE